MNPKRTLNEPPRRRHRRHAVGGHLVRLSAALMIALCLTACTAGADPESILAPSAAPTGASASSGDAARTGTGSKTADPKAKTPQQIVDDFRVKYNIVGLAVAVVTPTPQANVPQITYYVSGSPSKDVPGEVSPTTVFEIGSESKTYTATLLATLVDEGKVRLSDPLQMYAPPGIQVPRFTSSNGVITELTISDLATHTSGLPDSAPNWNAGCPGGTPCDQANALFTRDMMWQQLTQTKLLWQPGSNWLYSNYGFGILGTVLADLVDPGQQVPPFQSVLAAKVLSNFSMPATAVYAPGQKMATGYSYTSSGGLQHQPYLDDTNAMAGGGGMVSNATDLGVYVAASLGYAVGTTADADKPFVEATQPLVTAPLSTCTASNGKCPPSQQMGMGWQLYPAGTSSQIPGAYAFKSGGTPGFNTGTYLVPTRGTGVTVLANANIMNNDTLSCLACLGPDLLQSVLH